MREVGKVGHGRNLAGFARVPLKSPGRVQRMRASTVGGLVASPPVVGLTADAAGLRAGLLLVPMAGLVVALLATVPGVLSRARGG
ncbi:MAG: hypothetical protein WBN99_01965 [Mycobacterium sp.]